MARFVILEHDWPVLHWDLMLEAGEALRTWRLAAPPAAGQAIEALALGAHRRLYLDYEGEVSGQRGRVRRWDAGQFSWEVDEPERVVVWLAGGRLRGRFHLHRQRDSAWTGTLQAVSSP
jgi:hypothetical protein